MKATHLFGAPAAGREVEANCRFVETEFKHERFEGYRFADGARQFERDEEKLGEATLDEKGEKEFSVKVPAGLKPASSLTAEITATVSEVGGRAVTAGLSRPVDAYPRYVGLKRLREPYAKPGQEEKFACVLVKPDGSAIQEAELKATVCRVVWNTVLKLDEGHYRFHSEREEQPVAQMACAVRDGKAALAFTPPAVGEYVIRVADEKGGASADLTFQCAGEGEVAWTMEKPDRLELVLDKESYEPGDTAKVLLKSPFPGTALVTIEGDRIHQARVFRMEKNTHEISIPIEAAYNPNVYCAATVIRKMDSRARWSTNRAFGIVRIALDQSARQLQVGMDCSKEVRPGTPLRVKLAVKDSAGIGKPAEVTLAAVDEGICRLTDFKTPDPWAFFYSDRQLGVGSSDIYSLVMPEVEKKKIGSDSAAGGDGVGLEVLKEKGLVNPINAARVKPTALWKSRIVTGPDGLAEVTLDVPDRFTGELRLMAVAAAAQDFGSAEQPVQVKQPLMVQTSLPRFLAPGDEFEAPVTLFNNTEQKGAASLSTEGSAGIELVSAKPAPVEVDKGGEKTVSLRCRAPRLPGVARFKVTAALGAETASDEVELSVRPPSTVQFVSGSGRIEPDSNGSASVKITVPGGWVPKTDRYWLSFSPLPTLKLAGALRYVLHYPYGCVEQTTSGSFPLLYLSDLGATVDPEMFPKGEVADFVQAGIERLMSMQTSQGGFAMWPGGGSPYPWGSVYATHFLVEAGKAGHPVDEDRLDAAVEYLERLLSSRYREYGIRHEDEEEDADLPLKAYACFVLAKAGRPNASWTFRLYEEKEKLPAYAKCFLAGALALQKEQDMAKTLMKVEALPPTKKSERDTGGLLHSYARERAILLTTYLDLDPDSPHVPTLVRDLEAAMRDGCWLTTQENAFALMALGKYARRLVQQKTEYRAEVALKGKTLAAFTHKDRVLLRPEGIGGQDIVLKMTGTGPLFYYWAAEGVPQSGEAESKDEGLQVRRKLLSREGKEVDLKKIPQGEIVIVELSIKSDRPVENVVISDLLPAGLEIENPRLIGSGKVKLNMEDALNADRVDMRDDRLLVFASVRSDKEYFYRYAARAVTKGRFRLPAVSASCMYQPGICSTYGVGKIQVVDGR